MRGERLDDSEENIKIEFAEFLMLIFSDISFPQYHFISNRSAESHFEIQSKSQFTTEELKIKENIGYRVEIQWRKVCQDFRQFFPQR